MPHMQLHWVLVMICCDHARFPASPGFPQADVVSLARSSNLDQGNITCDFTVHGPKTREKKTQGADRRNTWHSFNLKDCQHAGAVSNCGIHSKANSRIAE
jgi:hypothetical protein